jgi:hypothetical protein
MMDDNQRDGQPSDQPEEGIVSQAPTGMVDKTALETDQAIDSGPLAGNGDR